MQINKLVHTWEEVVYNSLKKHCEKPKKREKTSSWSHKDRQSKREVKLRKQKTILKKKFKAMERGEISLSAAECKEQYRKFNFLVKKHAAVKKARLLKEKVKCEANERRKFRKDPWAYGTGVLNPPNGGKPKFDVAEAESHFVPLYEDVNREKKYGPPPGCKRPPPPEFKFNV